MSDLSKFKTLIIIDLETTGLIYDQPKIIELAMIAVNISTLEEMKSSEQLPRVLNKFIKFFDPVKLLPAEVAELTGLNNLKLMHYTPFNRETVLAIEAFLSDFEKPICYVAHNGYQFDFPILYNEIYSALSSPSFYSNRVDDDCIDEFSANNNSNSILKRNTITQTITTMDDHYQTLLLSIECADSLVFFRQMYQLQKTKISKDNVTNDSLDAHVSSSEITSTNKGNNNNSSTIQDSDRTVKYTPSFDSERQRPSMKLSKIYEREFEQSSIQFKAHRAEDDCLMLLAILKRYLPDWLEWIEKNHQPLYKFSSLATPSKATPSDPKDIVNINENVQF